MAGGGSVNDFLRRRSTRYGLGAVAYSFFFITIVVMLNFLGVRYNQRIDTSEANVNSLSDQSIQVLNKLEDDVEILAFVGPTDKPLVDQIATIYGYVSDRLTFRMVDPQVSPEIAQRELITQIPTLKIKLGDRSATVNRLDEESITNGINRVSSSEQKKLYFIEGHGEGDSDDKQSPLAFGFLTDALRNQNYIVEGLFLAEHETVPADAAALVVTASDRAYFPAEIDKLGAYIASGGSALFLLEPAQNLAVVEYLTSVGIEAGHDVVLDQQMRLFEGVTLGMDPVISSFTDHASVKPMKERAMLSVARSIAPVPTPNPAIKLQPLAFTATTSWAESDSQRVFENGEAQMDEGQDRPGPVPVAMAAEGPVSALGAEGDASFKVVVVGDKSFATNQYLQQLFNDALALSMIGWLAGEDQLISIGPRAIRASRAFLGQKQARNVFYLSVLVLPELILLAGIIVWWRRSSL